MLAALATIGWGCGGAEPRDPVVWWLHRRIADIGASVIDSTADSAGSDEMPHRSRRRSSTESGPLGARTPMHATAIAPASTVLSPSLPATSTDRLEREEIVEMICEINRGVGRPWLESFSTEELRRYLAHLELVLEPRGTVWVREPGAPATERRAA